MAAGPLAFALTPVVHPAGQVAVALVQPGYQAHPSPLGTASQRLTAGLGPQRPDLIVWGESSIGYDLRFHRALLDQLRRLFRRNPSSAGGGGAGVGLARLDRC